MSAREFAERLEGKVWDPFQERKPDELPTGVSFQSEPEPNFVDLLSAAGRLDFLGGNLHNYTNLAEARSLARHENREDLWNDEIFEKYPYLQSHRGKILLSSATTEREAYWINQSLMQEEEDRNLLDKDPVNGFFSRLAMGVISPENLVPMGFFFKGAKTIRQFAGAGAKTGFIGATMGETGLQLTQENRPVEESVFAVLGAPLIGSLLGGAVGTVSVAANKAYWNGVGHVISGYYHDAIGVPRGESIPVRAHEVVSQLAADARKLARRIADTELGEQVATARSGVQEAVSRADSAIARARAAYQEGLAEVRAEKRADEILAEGDQAVDLTPSQRAAVERARRQALEREAEAAAQRTEAAREASRGTVASVTWSESRNGYVAKTMDGEELGFVEVKALTARDKQLGHRTPKEKAFSEAQAIAEEYKGPRRPEREGPTEAEAEASARRLDEDRTREALEDTVEAPEQPVGANWRSIEETAKDYIDETTVTSRKNNEQVISKVSELKEQGRLLDDAGVSASQAEYDLLPAQVGDLRDWVRVRYADGTEVIFYMSSSGASGKRAGEWYPVNAISKDQWLVKDPDIVDHYGSRVFKETASEIRKRAFVRDGEVALARSSRPPDAFDTTVYAGADAAGLTVEAYIRREGLVPEDLLKAAREELDRAPRTTDEQDQARIEEARAQINRELDEQVRIADEMDEATNDLQKAHDLEEDARRKHHAQLAQQRDRAQQTAKDRQESYDKADGEARALADGEGEEASAAFEQTLSKERALLDEANAEARTAEESVGKAELEIDRSSLAAITRELSRVSSNIASLTAHTLKRMQRDLAELRVQLSMRRDEAGAPDTIFLQEEIRIAEERIQGVEEKIRSYREQKEELAQERRSFLTHERKEEEAERIRAANKHALLKFHKLLGEERKWDEIEDTLAFIKQKNPGRYKSLLDVYRAKYPKRPKGLRKEITKWEHAAAMAHRDVALQKALNRISELEAKMAESVALLKRRQSKDARRKERGKEPLFPAWRTERGGKRYESWRRQIAEIKSFMVERAREISQDDALEVPLSVPTIPARGASAVLPDWKDTAAWKGIIVHVDGLRGFIVDPRTTMKGYMQVYFLRPFEALPANAEGAVKRNISDMGTRYVLSSKVDVVLENGVPQRISTDEEQVIPIVRTLSRGGRRGMEEDDLMGGMWTPSQKEIDELNALAKAGDVDAYRAKVNKLLSEWDQKQVEAAKIPVVISEQHPTGGRLDEGEELGEQDLRGMGTAFRGERVEEPTQLQVTRTPDEEGRRKPYASNRRAINRAKKARAEVQDTGRRLEFGRLRDTDEFHARLVGQFPSPANFLAALREEIVGLTPLGKEGQLKEAGDTEAVLERLRQDGATEELLERVQAFINARNELRLASAEVQSISAFVPGDRTTAADTSHKLFEGKDRKMERVHRETERGPSEIQSYQERKRLDEKWAEDLHETLVILRAVAATHIEDPVVRLKTVKDNVLRYPAIAELLSERGGMGPSVSRVPGKSPVETPGLEKNLEIIDREIARAESELSRIESILELEGKPEEIVTGIGARHSDPRKNERIKTLDTFTRHLIIAYAQRGLLDPTRAAAHVGTGSMSRHEQLHASPRLPGTRVKTETGETIQIPEELAAAGGELPTEGRMAAIARGEVEPEGVVPATETSYREETVEIQGPDGKPITVVKKVYDPVPEGEPTPTVTNERIVELLMTPDRELSDADVALKWEAESQGHDIIARLEDGEDANVNTWKDPNDPEAMDGIPEGFYDQVDIDEAVIGIQAVWGTSPEVARKYASGMTGSPGDGIGIRSTGAAPDHANLERPAEGFRLINFLLSPSYMKSIEDGKPLKGLVDANGKMILNKAVMARIAALPEETKQQITSFADLQKHVEGVGPKTVEKLDAWEAGNMGHASHTADSPHPTPRTPEDLVSARDGSEMDDDLYGGVEPGDRPPVRGTHARTPPRKPPTGRGHQPYDVLGPGGAYGHHMQSILGVDEQQLQRILRHNPKLRLLLSDFDESRTIGQMLLDYGPIWMKEYADGKPKIDSVESAIHVNWRNKEIKILQDLPNLYVNAVEKLNGKPTTDAPSLTASRITALKERAKGKGKGLTPKHFYERVTRALRNGDRDTPYAGEVPIEEVTKAAQMIRRELFDPARRAMVSVRMLPLEMAEVYNNSYVTRVWNIQKLVDDRDEWLAIVKKELVDQGHTDIDATEIAEGMHEAILAGPEGRLDPLVFNQRRTRAGEARKVPGDDKMWGDAGFLENDIDVILKYWFRSTPADIELARLDMRLAPSTAKRSQYWKPDPSLRRLLNSTFSQMQARVDALPPGSIERRKLMRQMESDRRDLEASVDLLRHTYAIPKDPHGLVRRGAMALRRHNYLTDGGTFMLSSIPDLVRPAMVMGLSRVYGTGIRTLFRDWDTVKLNAREAELAGTAADWWTNRRTLDLYDLGGGYGVNRFERMLATASDEMSIINGLSAWNQHLKQWSGVMIAQRIIDYTQIVATGRKWDGLEASEAEIQEAIEELARAGISSEARATDGGSDAFRIWNQVKDKPVESRLRILETETWNDSGARQKFRSALRSGIDSTINTPGVGDRPLFMSRDMGRFVLQYKAFAFASTMQTTIPALQRPDAAFITGAGIATGFAMLSIYLKAQAGGWNVPGIDDEDGLIWWLRNGVSRAGFTGILDDINTWMGFATNGKATIGNVLTGSVDKEFLYTNRNLFTETFGPSVSTLVDAGKMGAAVTGIALFGEQPRKAEWNAWRRQTWLNNHFLFNKTFRDAFSGMEYQMRRKTAFTLDSGTMGIPGLREGVPFR